ncbi:hypothetical protein PVK06_019986 [Gossypium arboreum]|uniref:ABC1 atypical kinase-like domain-containing protein n=1 Tax=Gossypium arboreum TaxID=29729 RepID=A0ABR0PLT3_GOSAR|nr:hypothetical protein PVK06_019986 [Gossypium arboreum]
MSCSLAAFVVKAPLKFMFYSGVKIRPDLLDAALLRLSRLDRLRFCDFPSPRERGIYQSYCRSLFEDPLLECFELVDFNFQEEFGRSMGEIFQKFDVNHLGSASIAQAHQAGLRGDKIDVVVKVEK